MRIYLGGAGGAPTNNVIKSLRESGDEYLIGASSNPYDLFLADTDERYLIPQATRKNYKKELLKILRKTKPDFGHFQNDFEVSMISNIRVDIENCGIRLFLPSRETVNICVDKGKSFERWYKKGLKVPKTIILRNKSDLKKAFNELGDKIWVRAVKGAAGAGSLPTNNFGFALNWINHFNGWNKFTAAELLTDITITWLSIWYHGELVVAQTRKRRTWNFSDRSISGVTGITGVAETFTDDNATTVALDAIYSIDKSPHGIFGVDMTYDNEGWPNPTEINIGRFFTTVYFFTKAGLNMPRIYTDIGLYNKFPAIEKKINPLPDGLLWIRGMDVEPALVNVNELKKFGEF